MRCDGVQKGKRYVPVAIVIPGLDGNREFQRSTMLGAGVGDGWPTDRERTGDDRKGDQPAPDKQRVPVRHFQSEWLLSHLRRAHPGCKKGALWSPRRAIGFGASARVRTARRAGPSLAVSWAARRQPADARRYTARRSP